MSKGTDVPGRGTMALIRSVVDEFGIGGDSARPTVQPVLATEPTIALREGPLHSAPLFLPPNLTATVRLALIGDRGPCVWALPRVWRGSTTDARPRSWHGR